MNEVSGVVDSEETEGQKSIECKVDEIDKQELEDALRGALSMQPEGVLEGAPFRNYKENSDRAWAYVSDSEVRDYLKQFYFLSSRALDRAIHGMKDESVKIWAREDPIDIPIKVMINAAGFNSWLGRGSWLGIDDGKGDKMMRSEYIDGEVMSSIDTMKHYASLKTELPPISLVTLYKQPDGLIFGTNGSGDSHRIGAAMLRGNELIRAEILELITLKENVLKRGENEV